MPKTRGHEANPPSASASASSNGNGNGKPKPLATPDELAKFRAQKQPVERGLYRKAAARLANKSSAVEVDLDQL